jgi:sugar phosphate isomerase/epimerase
MEIDLYWMVKGGGDPLAYFAKWPGRFPMLHVKDMTRSGAMTDVGQGTIDFETIRRYAETAGVVHWFVEHDEPPNPLASARVSYAYLSALLAQPAPSTTKP